MPPVDVTLYSDASLQGWGAVLNDKSTGGRWLPTEREHHINYLALLAAFFALQCFHPALSNKHAKVMIDNTSAVAQINNMGTCHNEECNSLVVQIWEFCISHNITWLTAAHIRQLTGSGFAERSIKVITASWREGITAQY